MSNIYHKHNLFRFEQYRSSSKYKLKTVKKAKTYARENKTFYYTEYKYIINSIYSKVELNANPFTDKNDIILNLYLFYVYQPHYNKYPYKVLAKN